jgi:hypothetical protein
MKYALVADERVVEFVLGLMCGLLDDRPWR